jgi:hypothetical protein
MTVRRRARTVYQFVSVRPPMGSASPFQDHLRGPARAPHPRGRCGAPASTAQKRRHIALAG